MALANCASSHARCFASPSGVNSLHLAMKGAYFGLSLASSASRFLSDASSHAWCDLLSARWTSLEATPLFLLRQSRRFCCCRLGEDSRLGEEALERVLITTAMARDHVGRSEK